MKSTIMLIRHAEKPGEKWKGPGLTEEGKEDEESLVVRGWQRTGGLVLLFSGNHPGVPRPDRIFASGVLKKDGKRSKRPLQTVVPLARKLGQEAIQTFTKGEEEDLAAELATLGGVSLVSWQHENIPAIVQALLGPESDAPEWPDSRYDMIWIVDRPSRSAIWSFVQIGQGLLPGDD